MVEGANMPIYMYHSEFRSTNTLNVQPQGGPLLLIYRFYFLDTFETKTEIACASEPILKELACHPSYKHGICQFFTLERLPFLTL